MIAALLRSNGLKARALRGSFWTVFGYGGSQAIRLGSNLVLTRLLFPEAFGLMALVAVFLTGIMMLSDVGIGASVMQNERGDEPAFLDTIWSIQIIRGAILWLCTGALALPVAHAYGEPELALLLPAAGLGIIIAGFNPTRIETGYRHMVIGRVVAVDLVSQVIGLAAMIACAYLYRSVWSLVIGGLVGGLAKLVLAHLFIAGRSDRFGLDGTAVRDIVRFGIWILPSSICGFLIAQSDKLVLGRHLPLDIFGIYNIAYFLGSFPMLLAAAIVGRILLPVYRNMRERGSAANVLRMRYAFTGGILLAQASLIFIGPVLIEILYDPRYALASSIIVLIAASQLPIIIGMTYDQAALAAGDSRNFFFLIAARVTVQLLMLVSGTWYAGLLGALLGLLAAHTLNHVLTIQIARRHNVWDPVHDLIFALVAALVLAAGWAFNQDAIVAVTGL